MSSCWNPINLLSASLFKWHTAKIDFESAFNNSGDALRQVYVHLPRESKYRHRSLWLLLAASYGLVNANAKWQEAIDSFLDDLGFEQIVYVPQLFVKREEGNITVAAVKIVDDILFTGTRQKIGSVISPISEKYKLGTVVYGPGTYKYYGLTITQEEDFTVTIHADDKLRALSSYEFDRRRRKMPEEELNTIELSAFRSINSSISWMGVATSPFCAFTSSYLQQKLPIVTVSDMVTQGNMLKELQKLGTTMAYKRPTDNKECAISLLVFADASRPDTHGQLGYIAGLLVGDMDQGSKFHTLSWSSKKSKRPVKSIGSAETLATGSTVDEGKVLAKTLEILFGCTVNLVVALDSKDLYDTISKCRLATDRSIRGDVSLLRYDFETKKIHQMIWISGKTNLCDPLTKRDSPLISSLQLMLFSSEIPIHFKDHLTRSSNQSTGYAQILKGRSM